MGPSKSSKLNVDAKLVFVPPDGGWGWVIVLVTFMCNLISDGVMFTFGIFLEPLGKEFNVTIGQVALIGSVNSGFYFFAGPFVSALVNKFGFRIVGLCGGIMAAGIYCAASFCKCIILMIVVNGVLGGIALSFIYAPAAIVVGFYFAKWRALAVGLSTCGSGIGMLSIPPLVIYIQNRWGKWQYCYYAIAILLSICSIMALFYRPITPVVITEGEGQSNVVKPSVTPTTRADGDKTGCCAWCPCRRGLTIHDNPVVLEMVDTKIMQVEKFKSDSSESDGEGESSVSLAGPAVPSRMSRYSRIFGDDAKGKCKKGCYRFWTCYCIRNKKQNRPLYRDDIYYTQSLYHLPAYKKQEEKRKSLATILPRNKGEQDDLDRRKQKAKLKYHMSVTRAPPRAQQQTERKKFFLGTLPCLRAICTLLDCTLMKSPAFQLFSWCGLIGYLGYMIPFVYSVDRAIKNGIPKATAIWLLSTIGVLSTVGRIMSGILPSVTSKITATWYMVTMMFVGGIVVGISGLKFMLNVYGQFSFTAVFGFTTSCLASLRPVVVVELFGLEKLTTAFGLQMIFMGLGTSLGTVFGGLIFDNTQKFEGCFYLSGISLVISGFMLIFVKNVRQWEIRKGIFPE